MEKVTLYSIFHGRFPSEKAHGIFAARGAEAFSNVGVSVKLLVPKREGVNVDPFEYYKVEKNFSVHYLFTIDLFKSALKVFAFRLSLFVFSLSALFFILFDKTEKKIVYTNEIIPALFCVLFTRYKVVYELHDFPEQSKWLYRFVFSLLHKIIATNTWKKDELVRAFEVSPKRIVVELNAVDIASIPYNMKKEEAREKLSLPIEGSIVVYTGHFYSWKGTDTLLAAAKGLPDISFYFIGGTKKDVARIREKHREFKNIHIMGHVPHKEVFIWQAAADILVLPNTAKEKISKYYTSPMKLFEYMASKRPIIASDLPSVREVGGEEELFLVTPDDVNALKTKVQEVLSSDIDKTDAAFKRITEHTWEERARRILENID